MCDSIVAYTHVTTYYDGEYLTDFRSHPETLFILVKVNASGRYIANKHFHVFPADNGRIIKVFNADHKALAPVVVEEIQAFPTHTAVKG